MDNIEYQEKYVLFIDILGFSEMVMESTKDPKTFSNLHTTLLHIKKFAKVILGTEITNSGKIEISIFSDCIAISTIDTTKGLGMILAMASMIYCDLFHHGVMARGGLSKGKIYHSEGVIFGEGLVNAYTIESKTAIYPRVVVDDKVLTDLERDENPSDFRGSMRFEDFDGLQCLNVFNPNAIKMDPRISEWVSNGSYMNKGREAVRKSLTSANLSIRSKALWMKKYYNLHAANIGLEEI